MSDLQCGHCGGDAVLPDADGMYTETGEQQPCLECGFPGQVIVYDNNDEDRAYWSESDDPDARCRTACSECHPRHVAYRTPPPVYAECPSCGATVRVLPSGRWARHADSLLYPVGVRLLFRGRCKAGGRMRS